MELVSSRVIPLTTSSEVSNGISSCHMSFPLYYIYHLCLMSGKYGMF